MTDYDPDKILTTTDSSTEDPQIMKPIDLFILVLLTCIFILLLGFAVLMMS